MYKSKVILIICLLLSSAVSCAANEPEPLQLQCSIKISNYNGVDHASISKNVELVKLKHKTNGAVLVSQTDEVEFWVMIHAQQTLNDLKFFNDFQVAIKDKKTE